MECIGNMFICIVVGVPIYVMYLCLVWAVSNLTLTTVITVIHMNVGLILISRCVNYIYPGNVVSRLHEPTSQIGQCLLKLLHDNVMPKLQR